jgi:CxxC motif-containing protein (DUF1111 family)
VIKNTSIVLFLLVLISCKDDDYTDISSLYEEGEEFLTGPLGVNSTSSNAFGFEINGLSFQELAQFSQGNSLFNQSWVPEISPSTDSDGLGPTFNARSCAGCHFKDGRGRPLVNGEDSRGFLMRVSLPGQDAYGNANPVPGYNTQIQDRSNNGIPFEAKVTATYEVITGTYSDGSSYELLQPNYTFTEEAFGSLLGVETSPRVGQQTIGMGLISALPDTEILQFADEFDDDNDGISGRPNYVWNIEENTTTLGKYGWKANAPTLKQQVASAFHGDLGLTSSLFADNNCPSPQLDCDDTANNSALEVSNQQLDRVVFYQGVLAVPNRRNAKDPSVLEGKALFNELKCIACHAINMTTAASAINPLLENITIKPYSDFLLHDMGPALADNRPDFLANGNEWRTQPLWGIGLIPTVNGHSFFLHDGRARTVEEAILWHGGEAEASKQEFISLSLNDRNDLLNFINSL